MPETVIAQNDYAEALTRVRDFKEQLQRADRTADQNSLDRAADLELLYQSMRWVDEIPAPKNTIWRGRPVDPRSRNRFAGWVLQQTGLHPSRVGQLHRAHELTGIIGTGYKQFLTSEKALRPLARLRRAGYGDHIPEVYKRAIELAEGRPPTEAETRQAVRDFLARYTTAQRRQSTAAEALAKRQQAIRAQFVVLLGTDTELAGVTLNSLIDLYNERLQK